MSKPPYWKGARILVIGDIILDRFIYGRVERISPEAPIPVVQVTGERLLPGGAANVAHNIRSLGGQPRLLGVTGADANAQLLRAVLKAHGIPSSGVLEVGGRVTTVKTRVVAHHQQVVRVDREARSPLGDAERKKLLEMLDKEVGTCRALLVSDYAKGLFDSSLLERVGEVANRAGVPYLVDPKPPNFPYPGATLVTPNREEAAGFFGGPFDSADLDRVARDLLERADWKAVLFTLGPEGMALAERGKPVERIPARVREVFDVTGAGDTVVSVLALALAAGESLPRAARLANAAAGVVVTKAGTAVCTTEELKVTLREET